MKGMFWHWFMYHFDLTDHPGKTTVYFCMEKFYYHQSEAIEAKKNEISR
jgi:hypothetical protein